LEITSIQNSTKYNNYATKRNISRKIDISFCGKTINGNYYTDQEYVDAMNNKDYGVVLCCDFEDRYSFWEYFFTDKPNKHAAEVNKCIKDILEVEKREAAARAEKLKKFEEAKKRNENELLVLKKKEEARQNIINSFTEINKTQGLGTCDVNEETQKILTEAFLQPLGEKIADGIQLDALANAVLVSADDSQRSENVVKALAEQILKDKMQQNFTEICYDNDSKLFQSALIDAKQQASQKHSKNKDISVIYIPNFDKIALRPKNPQYDYELNSFLKAFMLDCAQNGVFVFATAENANKIEPPFLINNRRFGVNVNLDDEE